MRNKLHSLCPYFAMFPEDFPRKHIKALTRAGDLVFDPFSGRGTTILEALLLDRKAVAMDVNPVAYCISAAKADIPSLKSITTELDELENRYEKADMVAIEREGEAFSPFFRRAFYHSTFKELLFLRSVLA